MTKTHDLAVVGAGFAGLAAAKAAAAHGLDVVVLDRQSHAGARVRTTGILVKEAAEEAPIPQQLVRSIRRVRLYAPNLRHFDLASPGYYFLVTETHGLMRWFANRTKALGAELRWGETFSDARIDADRVVIGSAGVAARMLIGADGPRSEVARRFGLGINRAFLVGAEAEIESVRGIDDCLHVFLDRELARGYIAWVVPAPNGLAQVGLACRPPARPNLAKFIEKAGRVFDFSDARIVGRRGGPIPVGGRVSPIANQHVLLTGDAAGLVSPLTAGGIHTALHYGRLAGRAAAAWLDGKGPPPGPVIEREYPRFRWKRTMRGAADRMMPDPLVDAVIGLPPMRRLARLVFFHTRGLASAEAWRDVFRGEG